MNTKGAYNFEAKAKQYRGYTVEQLHYALTDIRETIEVWSDSPSAGWYADDLHTVAAEIGRREAKGPCPNCGK